jgi:hypothetical protein
MATFLVERYWPGVTLETARAVSDAIAAAADPPGSAHVVETILAATDEVCFWYVEAASAAAIRAAFAVASIPIDRVAAATAIDSGAR